MNRKITNMVKLPFFGFSIFVTAWFMACSSNNSSSANSGSEVDPDHDDFILIHSSKSTVTLGSNSTDAKSSEKPEMKVKFSYDFSIGKHEVTCGEFKQIMEKDHEELVENLSCESKEHPVANVTYFDAVLFAIAKSKAEKLGSAYTYNKATYDSEGHCTNLEGLAFQPAEDGYRLPTEAEWIFAAKQDWSAKDSWTAKNSDYESHEVCSKTVNKTGLCDMSGNLKEWTNDWLGKFRDTTITDYVGAPGGGNLGERVIKGGSFRSEEDAINTYSRGDVYTVTSTTKSSYLGFRLAIGPIQNPTWLSNNGSASNSRTNVLASSSTLKDLVGTYKAKLAFRNDITENLSYIDYASGTLSVIEIQDTISVFHPEISPDGNKVAFCTNSEGIDMVSSIYVRDLNSVGSNLVKLDVESAAIPRWRVLDNGDTAIVYVSNAGDNTNEGTFKSYSTWQVVFSRGTFGTPKKLFDGNYHDGISSDNKLAVTGSRLFRARIQKDDKDFLDTIWYDGKQVCNVSLSKDESKKSSFLDFGGEGYGVHKMLLIADSNGNVVQQIPSPTGYAFDHSEWASADFIVSTLTNSHGVHEKITLVSTKDSSFLDLLAGEELWHPSLWIKPSQVISSAVLDPDSAGQYYTSSGSEAALILRNKMEILWKYRDAKLAIVGSSRSNNGANNLLMDESLNAINLSNIPNSIYVSDYLYSNYLLKHFPDLKYVVVSLDIDMWWKTENEDYDNFFYKEYKKIPGFVYDENHNFWEDGYPEGLLEATHESFNYAYYDSIYSTNKGFWGESGGNWEENPTVDYDSSWFDKKTSVYYENLDKLESMMISAENRGIYLIGVIFPMSPNYKNTGSFGRYGIRRSIAPKLIEELASYSKKYPHFILMDENKMGDHDYEFDEGTNRDHLNEKGAVRFTHRLDSLIKTLE